MVSKDIFKSLFLDSLFHKEERMTASKTYQRIGLLWKRDKVSAKHYLRVLEEEGLIRSEREGRGRGKLNFVKLLP